MQSTAERFRNIKKIGTHSKWTQDIYHTMLTIGWVEFFLFYVGFFVCFNLAFAGLFWGSPGDINGTDNSFWNAFVFSVQTFSTVGYGAFSPKTDYAHDIVIVESILSVFVTAVLTGLIFSKFSRPSARIVFTKSILVNNFEGKRMLMFRMGNMRANQIAEAQVRMVVLKSIVTVEGERIRKQIDLQLVRSSSLFFALTWSVMHVIDESSPFYGLTAKDLVDQNVDIGVSVIGYDSTFSQTIHATGIYGPEDVVFDRYFDDVFDVRGKEIVSINYHKFDELKPVQ